MTQRFTSGIGKRSGSRANSPLKHQAQQAGTEREREGEGEGEGETQTHRDRGTERD